MASGRACLLLVSLGACVPGPGVHAVRLVRPGFQECHFPAVPGRPGAAPLVLRFLLGDGLRQAFLLGVPAARPVVLHVSASGEVTLIDYLQDQAVAVLTVGEDDRAVYSVHRLNRGQNPARTVPGFQRFGQCYPLGASAGLTGTGDKG
jgi:hypothetical protein